MSYTIITQAFLKQPETLQRPQARETSNEMKIGVILFSILVLGAICERGAQEATTEDGAGGSSENQTENATPARNRTMEAFNKVREGVKLKRAMEKGTNGSASSPEAPKLY
ncbi:uncharacterized protein LOC116161974 [Photinus pyralis]|uniref:uncharacterized protein LOC116161009 n=1 Tax=Photinus pyralis TaxID=7054 RepID=UPI0012676E97|nr:uncharacterized protein LOC116161009 [Photinus pyralis]XP_031331346.1 uncharacterized protein LOC116161974 [Photinus pyralis]